MTRKEFELLRSEIEQQRFEMVVDSDPMRFAVERAAFKQAQLRKLISLGNQVENSRTVAAKIKRWERLIIKLDDIKGRYQRYQRIKQENVGRNLFRRAVA